jgi:hypothetical protein
MTTDNDLRTRPAGDGPDVRVRPARSHDLNAVVALWQGCGLVPSEQGFRNELTYKLLREPWAARGAVKLTQLTRTSPLPG